MGCIVILISSDHFFLLFYTNLPSEVIRINDISAGVPTNAPVAPATTPGTAIKGQVSFDPNNPGHAPVTQLTFYLPHNNLMFIGPNRRLYLEVIQ